MCEYCESKTTKFDCSITDEEENCKWCDKEKCDNYNDNCYGQGYTWLNINYCPMCGRRLNNDRKM